MNDQVYVRSGLSVSLVEIREGVYRLYFATNTNFEENTVCIHLKQVLICAACSCPCSISRSQPLRLLLVLMKKTVIQLKDDAPTADHLLNGKLPDSHSEMSVTVRCHSKTQQTIPLF